MAHGEDALWRSAVLAGGRAVAAYYLPHRKRGCLADTEEIRGKRLGGLARNLYRVFLFCASTVPSAPSPSFQNRFRSARGRAQRALDTARVRLGARGRKRRLRGRERRDKRGGRSERKEAWVEEEGGRAARGREWRRETVREGGRERELASFNRERRCHVVRAIPPIPRRLPCPFRAVPPPARRRKPFQVSPPRAPRGCSCRHRATSA